MLRVSLAVPCYNEASRLQVDRFRAFLEQHPEISFVLVNDGSRDETAKVLHELGAGFAPGRADVIDRKENRGKGESVREGVLFALDRHNPDIVGFWDADLATPLEAVYDMLPVLATQPAIQMVFGARVNLLGRHIARKAVRHYLGRVFATAVSVMLDLPVYDTQCGAKLFRASPQIRRIFSDPFITRWVFDVELIARWIKLHGLDRAPVRASVFEFPLYLWEDIGGSKVKPGDFFRAFFDVLRIYRRYFF